jgi:hypothetical protein
MEGSIKALDILRVEAGSIDAKVQEVKTQIDLIDGDLKKLENPDILI